MSLLARTKFIAIFQLVIALSWLMGVPACAKEQALVLSGRSSEFAAVDFKISSQTINANNRLGMMIWTVSDPDRVTNLNSETKVFLRHPLDDWRLSEGRSRPRPLERVELIDKPTLCGQKCNHYIGYAKRRMGGAGQAVPAVEFWCLQKSPCPPAVLAAWCSLFKLPTDYGFPIQVEQASGRSVATKSGARAKSFPDFDSDSQSGHGGGGHWSHVFSLAKVGHAPAETLATKAPVKYKAVQDRAGLMFGRGGSFSAADMDDLFGKFKP